MSNLKVNAVGDKYWYNDDGLYHRLDGPACEYANGAKSWYVEGNLHRLDGPAIEWANGTKHWWVDGSSVTESEYPQAVLLYKCKQILES